MTKEPPKTAEQIIANVNEAVDGMRVVLDPEIARQRMAKDEFQSNVARRVRNGQGYEDPKKANAFFADAMPPGLEIGGSLTNDEFVRYCGLLMPMKEAIDLEALWQRSQGNDKLLYLHNIPEPAKTITPERAREKFYEEIFSAMAIAHEKGQAHKFTLEGRVPSKEEVKSAFNWLGDEISPEAREFVVKRLEIERMAQPPAAKATHRRP